MESHSWVDHHEKSQSPQNKNIPVVHVVNSRSLKVLDWSFPFFHSKTSHQDDKVCRSIENTAKRLKVQNRLPLFNSLDLISSFRFRLAFMLACEKSGAHKKAALRSLHFYEALSTAPNICIALVSKLHKHHMQGTVSYYCEHVKYRFETKAIHC